MSAPSPFAPSPLGPFTELADLPALLPRRGRLLGLDLGEKTIGLALSNSDLTLASPLRTIRRRKFTEDAMILEELCREREVAGLVVGLPLNMDGSEGRRARSTRQFARNLIEIAGFRLPVALWDERLSTAAVERFLVEEADMSRRRRGEVVDKMAAAFILQGALDSLPRDRPAPDRA
ncbi:MAG: Holliday junction resolvase RuvX [Tistlia sp.]|uniref:Holliday junction resolvase RuvX n=1 Tax=Tistlia sp. TaxID=3057121 RepID=UPI0034A5C8A9